MSDKTHSDISVKRICEAFWKAESDRDLLEKEDNGVFFWRLLRFPLYYDIVQKCGIFDAPHPNASFDAKDMFRNSLSVLKVLICDHPFFVRRKYNFIVMPHPRKIDGKDIYTQALLEFLPEDQVLLLYKDWKIAPQGKGANMFAYAFLASLCRKIRAHIPGKKLVYEQKNYDLLADLEKYFAETLGVEAPLKHRAELEKDMFDALSRAYKKLFLKTKARCLYLTVAYANCAAVHAARECGLEIIELQHGIFTRFHLGYSFPDPRITVPYLPDKIFCFGRFWPENTPLHSLRPYAIGAPYILNLSKRYGERDGVRTAIVFTSQGVIGQKLYLFAIRVARSMPQETFIFRLHPSESAETYENMIDCTPPANLTISHVNPNVFSLLASAKIQVGVFSTTLFEGMILGCKTILVDMPGIEYMEGVLQRGDAVLIKTPDEFPQAMSEAPICMDPDYYYATQANINNPTPITRDFLDTQK